MDVIHASVEGGELIPHGYGGTMDQQSAATPRRGSISEYYGGCRCGEDGGCRCGEERGKCFELRMVLEVECVV
jgi:hypothetical protein